jgi:hypothetical protein
MRRHGRRCTQLLDYLKEKRRECTFTLKRKNYVARCGDLAFEEAINLPQRGLRNERITQHNIKKT